MSGEENTGSWSALFSQMVDVGKRTASRNIMLGVIAVLPGILIMIMGWYLAVKDTVTLAGTNEHIDAPMLAAIWSFLLMGGGFIVLLIGDLWCTLGAIHLVERERAGEHVSVGDALAAGWRRFWSGLGFTLIEVFVVGGFAFVGLIILILIATPPMVLAEGSSGDTIISVIVTLVIALLILVPTVYLLVIWSLGLNAVVIEKSGPIDSFNHSKNAVKGVWWKVLVFSILAVLSYMLVSMLITGLLDLIGIYVSAPELTVSESETPTAGDLLAIYGSSIDEIVEMGLNYILAMLVVPVYTTVLYMWRKEAMQAAVVEAVSESDLGDFNQVEE